MPGATSSKSAIPVSAIGTVTVTPSGASSVARPVPGTGASLRTVMRIRP
jgi:hypothetical protein